MENKKRIKISVSMPARLRDMIQELADKEGLTFSGALSLIVSRGLRSGSGRGGR